MVSDKGIAYFAAKVRCIAHNLGLPEAQTDFEVARDGIEDRTAYVQFNDAYDQESAERVVAELVKDPHLADEGLWGDDYAAGLDEEPWEGCERQYYFDVSALEDPSFIQASAKDREDWRKEHYFEPRQINRPTENVFLTMRYRFFNDIEAGRKTVECRQYTQTWVDKLIRNNLRFVTFQRGYEKGAKQMTFEIEKIEIADGDGRHRYSVEQMPDFADPEWILIRLGKRVF